MQNSKKTTKLNMLMIIMAIGILLSGFFIYTRFSKARNTDSFVFASNGNKYVAEFKCSNKVNPLKNFCITKVEQTTNTGNLVLPTTIKIPDTITIGNGNYSVESIGGGTTNTTFISKSTFSNGNLSEKYNDNTSKSMTFVLPNGLKNINDYAFSDFDKATNNVIISLSCINIGSNVFNKKTNIFVQNPNTKFASGDFTSAKVIGYENSTAKEYGKDNFVSYTNFAKSYSLPDGCSFPSTDTSFKVNLSVDGVNLYNGKNGSNTASLNSTGLFSSYLYMTDEMLSDKNSGIKTTVNKAKVSSNNGMEHYKFTGFYTKDGNTELFDYDGDLTAKSRDLFNISNDEATVYAKFTPKTYPIWYYECVNKNSEDVNEMTVNGLGTEIRDAAGFKIIETSYEYGKDVTLPVESENFKRMGYTFNGWYSKDSNKDVTKIEAGEYGTKNLEAQWKANTYKITYDFNGGTKAEDSKYTESHTYGESPVYLASAVKAGYDFAGWFTDKSDKAQKEYSRNQIGDITYIAKWSAHKYKVVFDTTGLAGEIESEYFTVNGEKIDLTQPKYNVSAKGYTFRGWYDNTTGTQYKSIQYGYNGKDNYNKLEDLHLVAKLTVSEYKVTCYLNGGTITGYQLNNNKTAVELTHTYGVKEPLPQQPERAGYTFAGWYDNSDKETKYSEISADVSNDLVLIAIWNKNKYTASYDLDGGKVSGELKKEFCYDSESYKLPVPTKEGYTFNEWIDVYSHEAVTEIKKGTLENKSFKATWKPNSYKISYSSNAKDATLSATTDKERVFDEKIILPKPERSGYNFAGWYDNKKCTGNAYTSDTLAKVAKDITLYAKWSPISYEITYDLGFGKDKAIMPQHETKFTVESAVKFPIPTWKGHTFKAWDVEGKQLTTTEGIIGNIYARAIWNDEKFTVTYAANGGTIKDKDYAKTHFYGTSETLPSTVEKAGYQFAGWYVNKDLSGASYSKIDATTAKNVIFYAKWTPVTYHVYYDLGSAKEKGGTCDKESDEFTVEKELTLAIPSWSGHSFRCWIANNNGKDKVIEKVTKGTVGDIKLTAAWNTDSSEITYETNGGTIKDSTVTTKHFYGDSEGLPTNVEKTGYVFKGWYDNPQFSGKVYTETDRTKKDSMKFYAKWTGAVYTYSFKLDGGTLAKNNTVNDEYFDEGDNTIKETYGEIIKLPKVYKTGCNASSEWKVVSDGHLEKTFKEGDKVDIAEDITLSPVWTAGVHKMYFDLKDGTFSANVDGVYENSGKYFKTVTYSTDDDVKKYETLPTVTKDGYEFIGWADKNGEFITETDEVKITEDTVFYAQYKKIKKTTSYQIEINTIDNYSFDESKVNEYIHLDNTIKEESPIAKNAWFKTKAFGEYYSMLDVSTKSDTETVFNAKNSGMEKAIYRALWNYYHDGQNVNKLLKFYTNAEDVKIDGENIRNALFCFTEDHPELTWLRSFYYSVSEYNNQTYYTIIPAYDYNASDVIRNFMTTETSDQYKNMLSEVKKGKTTADTIDSIASVICKNFTYTNDKDKDGNYSSKYRDCSYVINQSKNHECVCVGYAYTFKLMCNYFNIDCIANGGSTSAGAHEWNYVKIGNKYYGVDLTWIDDDEDKNRKTVFTDDYYLSDAKTFGVKAYNGIDGRVSDNYAADINFEKVIPLATKAYSRTITVGNFKYKIENSNKCSVLGLSAKGKKLTKLKINDTVTYNGMTYSIRKIAAKAFKGNTKLKEAAFNNSYSISIGNNAFEGCKNLLKIKFNDNGNIKFGTKSFKLNNKKKCKVSFYEKSSKNKKAIKKAGLKKM